MAKMHAAFEARGGYSIVKLKTTCKQKKKVLFGCITKMGQTSVDCFP